MRSGMVTTRSFDHIASLAADPLSKILQDLRPAGVSYGHCRLTRPWGVGIEAEPAARLHFVVSGESWFRTTGFGPASLRTGDAVLLPKGIAHAMADTPRGRVKPLST